VAAVIDNRILCMHGGISPHLESFDDIRKIERPTDVPESGLLTDLLWADPEAGRMKWGPNMRGVSVSFNAEAV